MNFDFSEDQRLVQKTARDFLEDQASLQVNRSVLESEAHYAADLWKSAAEMGWLGAAVPESFGGAGFSYLELVLIAEEVGRALAPIPFGSSVYLATEAILADGTPEQKSELLPALVGGDRIGTLALAEGPGQPGAEGIQTRFEAGRLNGTKVAVPDGNVADLAVVVARSGEAISLALVDLDGEGVVRTGTSSIDPTRSLATLCFTDAPARPLGGLEGGWERVERLLDRAAVLTAFEQIGGAQRAFDITREYAMSRYAFGRPIASFQALKHRLADLYVAIELARSNCFYGAWALEHDADELGGAACSARVSATEAFELAAVEMIQIHGGVGFTWEYDCHMFYRRSKHLAVVLGSAAHWKDRFVQRLVSSQSA